MCTIFLCAFVAIMTIRPKYVESGVHWASAGKIIISNARAFSIFSRRENNKYLFCKNQRKEIQHFELSIEAATPVQTCGIKISVLGSPKAEEGMMRQPFHCLCRLPSEYPGSSSDMLKAEASWTRGRICNSKDTGRQTTAINSLSPEDGIIIIVFVSWWDPRFFFSNFTVIHWINGLLQFIAYYT